MIARRTAPAAYWEEVGRQALAQGVECVIIMGARKLPAAENTVVAVS
jgi:hypothetical protein